MAEFQEGKSELTALARDIGWREAIAQQFRGAELLKIGRASCRERV